MTVDLPGQSYPIYLGNHLLTQQALIAQHIIGSQVLIVTQKNVARYYLDSLLKNLPDHQCDVIYLQEGELYKTLPEWQKMIDVLLQKKHERSTTLIALGGGIVGDMTGFAAGCYQRGVNYIQIPTSLIGQVDSSVGGKTGVNHALGKNMIGLFYQPQCVIIDIQTLLTLPPREFISGLAEVIKYGLIYDAEFFSWLEKNISQLLVKNEEALEYAIQRCLEIKSDIVNQDERDQGLRNILNYGHTLGHAIEAASSYNQVLHGEAVAYGMLMASQLSVMRGFISSADDERIRVLLRQCGFLQSMPGRVESADLVRFMKQDKKVHAGKVNFILLSEIGKAIKIPDIADQEMLEAIKKSLP